ncbi:hypothetical protein Ddye_008313 [Dipteronia dyeriana]|uniref:TTF-type domain-containing protein n=1 Tax=Dipteronia dyeriana TaxID=168575 RepID=A0AAD9X964_9ROSI|nr:hypothetical protein Ddye_008313 [Dipteronia dyeriana]
MKANDNEELIQPINENDHGEPNQHVNEEDNEDVQNVDVSEELVFPLNIDDPRNWDNIHQNVKDFLVERGPKRDNDVIFPKDNLGRHFSSSYNIQNLPNGEKHDRKWLVYSVSLDKVFCFCCKLFKQDRNKTQLGQLANDGFKDWKNISVRLTSHETRNDHIGCMSSWIELERRLQKNKTKQQRERTLEANYVEDFTLKPLSETCWESRVESIKAIRYQSLQIRDALAHLVETSEDPKTNSEVESIVTYEFENFEFLFGMVIWYNLLFAINSVTKIL